LRKKRCHPEATTRVSTPGDLNQKIAQSCSHTAPQKYPPQYDRNRLRGMRQKHNQPLHPANFKKDKTKTDRQKIEI